MKGKEQRWDTFVSYSNLKSPPTGVLEETQRSILEELQLLKYKRKHSFFHRR